MKVKFYLLRSKSKTETGLICSVSFDKKRIRFCIGESIHPKYWNSKISRARTTPSFPESQEFNQRLGGIVSKVNKLYLRHILTFKNQILHRGRHNSNSLLLD